MTANVRDKIYEIADAASRSSATAWTSVYELAVQSNDKNLWVVEEAVWTAYVQTCGVRNAALEQQHADLAASRQRGRDSALAKMRAGGINTPTPAVATAAAASAPVPEPAPVEAQVSGNGEQQVPQAPPAAPAAPPAPAAQLSSPQSAWERAEAAALAADQGANGVTSP